MGAPVLLFDGDCGFCSSVAAWFSARSEPPAVAAPWQSYDLAQVGLSPDQASEAVWFINAQGHRSSGADGIVGALNAMRPPWKFAGRALGLPGAIHLARLAYPLVAANRHRLPGGTPACEL